MFNIINERGRDPLGCMLLDYLKGNENAFLHVWSDTFDMWQMMGSTMYRSYSEMDELETYALSLCRGNILDVGAGSGCHSLYLQEQDMTVDAIDISPGCIDVMRQRGVKEVYHTNLFSLENVEYDTILMLMNGIGICGSLDGCNLFLQFVKQILGKGGQVLAESTPIEAPKSKSPDNYHGETVFVMQYREIKSDPFPWIYIDYPTLESLVHYNNLSCVKLFEFDDGRYLVRISG